MSRVRQDFQFFDPALAQLQERELAVHKVRSLSPLSDRVLILQSETKWDYRYPS
jgi:hypothetical protein